MRKIKHCELAKLWLEVKKNSDFPTFMKHGIRVRIAIILMPVLIRIWIGINIAIRIHIPQDKTGAMFDF
jgi:hypothetical protein